MAQFNQLLVVDDDPKTGELIAKAATPLGWECFSTEA
jgi:DNA-binding response OmpR family regulator